MNVFGIYWANPDAILLFPFLAIALMLLVRHHAIITRAIGSLVQSAHLKKLFPGVSSFRLRTKIILRVIALPLLFIALLQPQWGKKERVVEQEGRDVLVVLDISRSMLAADMRPSRLEFIKLKIRALLERLQAERVGLLLFSGSAFLQCPLTSDHAAFLLFLDQVDVETIASGTTAIDKALERAMEVFGRSQGRKNKLVVLATDGEDFSQNLARVKQKALREGIKLFALGIGSIEGAPIPILDAYGNKIGHEKNESGTVALSKLNEKMLQKLCTELDGTYVRTTYADTDLDTIVSSIQQFEKEKFTDKKISMYEDHYPWLLGAALFLLAVEWIL